MTIRRSDLARSSLSTTQTDLRSSQRLPAQRKTSANRTRFSNAGDHVVCRGSSLFSTDQRRGDHQVMQFRPGEQNVKSPNLICVLEQQIQNCSIVGDDASQRMRYLQQSCHNGMTWCDLSRNPESIWDWCSSYLWSRSELMQLPASPISKASGKSAHRQVSLWNFLPLSGSAGEQNISAPCADK